MKLGWLLGIASAVFVHVFVLLFGGAFFANEKHAQGALTPVDLLDDIEDTKPKDKPLEEEPETAELDAEQEQPPDATELVKNLEIAPINDAPALEAASLSAIEAALNGQSGGGEFGEALSFASGGRIGGTGKAGELGETAETAFSLAEIDQKPRAVFQASPVYPAQLRGKKIEAVVTLIFVVDEAGKVSNPQVEKSSDQAFESAAVHAVKKWKFEPGLRAGQRVATKMRVSIRFPAT